MPSWFHRSHNKAETSSNNVSQAPPEWTAANERSYADGKYADAPEIEYQDAERFCATYPLEPPKLLPSWSLDGVQEHGGACWTMEVPQGGRFVGRIDTDVTRNVGGSFQAGYRPPGVTRIRTERGCGDTCLLSNIPIIAGQYQVQHPLKGVYFEIKVNRMDGVIAIGTACKPYPPWRLPGWNRLSGALHLDDKRKFFENPNGGQDYPSFPKDVRTDDIIGCGYEFQSGELFYTCNGSRLAPAFKGLYFPHTAYDVYAAIGVDGENDFEVNFGADRFVWKPANTDEWDIKLHVHNLNGVPSVDEGLPSYGESIVRN